MTVDELLAKLEAVQSRGPEKRQAQCQVHEDGEDLIDFAVSNVWLDWYHQEGLTPRCSDQFQRGLACGEVCREHELLERAAS